MGPTTVGLQVVEDPTAFCDFCKCEQCRNGGHIGGVPIHHAQCSDGQWICEICYTYDVCTSGPNRSSNGPCKDKDCKHRPKLVSRWIPFKR